ncbi:MAG: elongation factor 1-beta [Candidatus Thermoplasmatota archaeon]|nr:elongation factor 1-beta [Candidatus Thermoplasmatota archaeon]
MMGDVAVVLRVLPSDADVDIEALRTSITDKLKLICEVNRTEVQEIGYGLKAMKFQIIVPDEEGRIDRVEETISSVEGVGQVDAEDVTLV